MPYLEKINKLDLVRADKAAIKYPGETPGHYHLKTKEAEEKSVPKQQMRFQTIRMSQIFLCHILKKKIKAGLLMKLQPLITINIMNQYQWPLN